MKNIIKQIAYNLLTGTVAFIFSLTILFMQAAIYIIHSWTIFLAFKNETLGNTILTLFTPVLSEIYWVRRLWTTNPIYRNLTLIEGGLLFFGLIFIIISYFTFDYKKGN